MLNQPKDVKKMKTTKMLKKNYEFKQVLTKGKYYSGNYIKAYIIKNYKQNNLLGLAISTKVRKSTSKKQNKKVTKRKLQKYGRQSEKRLQHSISNKKRS